VEAFEGLLISGLRFYLEMLPGMRNCMS